MEVTQVRGSRRLAEVRDGRTWIDLSEPYRAKDPEIKTALRERGQRQTIVPSTVTGPVAPLNTSASDPQRCHVRPSHHLYECRLCISSGVLMLRTWCPRHAWKAFVAKTSQGTATVCIGVLLRTCAHAVLYRLHCSDFVSRRSHIPGSIGAMLV